jgi:hypothetical protein
MANKDVPFGDSLDMKNVLTATFNTPNRAQIFPQISTTIFPFPAGPDCCCPEDVACLHRSADGQYYVGSKGIQKRS